LTCYISEQPYEVSAELAIIVTDIRKALAILSMAFYDYPQEKLKLIGITGTKGKTTVAYFTKQILDIATNKKTALLSTLNTTLDGVTFFQIEADDSRIVGLVSNDGRSCSEWNDPSGDGSLFPSLQGGQGVWLDLRYWNLFEYLS
jgi:hypothetical protein